MAINTVVVSYICGWKDRTRRLEQMTGHDADECQASDRGLDGHPNRKSHSRGPTRFSKPALAPIELENTKRARDEDNRVGTREHSCRTGFMLLDRDRSDCVFRRSNDRAEWK